MIIDAHQHFWEPDRGDYGWLTPDQDAFWRRFEPDDLEPDLKACGVTGTVLVQAAPTRRETSWLLQIAETTPWVLGVVGWVDLLSPGASDAIATLARQPHLVGVRPMLQDLADPAWIAQAALDPALSALSHHHLTFDALIRIEHAPFLVQMARRHPDLAIIVDHAAKPDISGDDHRRWARVIKDLAALPNLVCKLSGLLSQAGPGAGPQDLAPYVDTLLATFGASRLIWGSDWPVLTAVADYSRWHWLTDSLLQVVSEPDRHAILAGNAITTYGLTLR